LIILDNEKIKSYLEYAIFNYGKDYIRLYKII